MLALLIYLIYFILAFSDSAQLSKLISYAKQLTECTQRIEEALKEHSTKFDRLLENQQSKEQNT